MQQDGYPQNNFTLSSGKKHVDYRSRCAGRDCGLPVFPYAAHGYGKDLHCMMRHRWDYFAKTLFCKEPPTEYQVETKADPKNNGLLLGF
jgi:hypothetical protein